MPVGGLLSRKLAATRKTLITCSDARLKLTTEVLLGIKTIKCAPSLGPPSSVPSVRHPAQDQGGSQTGLLLK